MTMKNDTKFGEKSTCRFKIDMGNWRILTWTLESLKHFRFNVLHLSKVYIASAKKGIEELSFMTLDSDEKFVENLTCGLENNVGNLANFHQITWKR